jgi:hypothetical protein
MDQQHMVAIKEITAQTYRFWRLSCTGVSYVELAYLFIGKRMLVGEADLGTGNGRSMDYNWTPREIDLSTYSENSYGVRFGDETVVRKRWAFVMNLLTRNEYDDLFEVSDYCRLSKPFFLHVDAAILNNNKRLAGVFQFDSLPDKGNSAHALWSGAFNISEVM